MKITILGSGTFVPELKRTCSSYLLEKDNKKIVFDFGRGTIRNLLKLKINLYDIDKIFISHMHTDHSTELASFIQFIIDAPEKQKLKDEYTIYGPRGIQKDIQNMFKTFHIEKHKHISRIKIKEIKKALKIGPLKIKSFEAKHNNYNTPSLSCLGYNIFSGKKKLCYSGDGSYCESLKEACKNADLAIVEATGPKEWNLKGHISGEDLGKLAQETKIKKLVVTHIANTYLPRVKKDIRMNYNGKMIMAKDLMEFRL